MKILESFTRIYIDPEKLHITINFYEQLFNQQCHLRFKYPEYHLELAAVGSVLIIAGNEQNRKPFETTQITYRVDDIEEFKEFLLDNGAEIIKEPQTVPTGINMRIRHPDGTIAEYVEHKS